MAVLCILGFVNVSNLAYGLRLAYMFVTYVLYEALYTCVNVPFGTLSSVMTDDVRHPSAFPLPQFGRYHFYDGHRYGWSSGTVCRQ